MKTNGSPEAGRSVPVKTVSWIDNQSTDFLGSIVKIWQMSALSIVQFNLPVIFCQCEAHTTHLSNAISTMQSPYQVPKHHTTLCIKQDPQPPTKPSIPSTSISPQIPTHPRQTLPHPARQLIPNQAPKNHDIPTRLHTPLHRIQLSARLKLVHAQRLNISTTCEHAPEHDIADCAGDDGRQGVERLRAVADGGDVAARFGGKESGIGYELIT